MFFKTGVQKIWQYSQEKTGVGVSLVSLVGVLLVQQLY